MPRPSIDLKRPAIDWKKPDWEKIDVRAVGAELISTALFVWAGCGAAVASQKWGNGSMSSSDLVSISLGFGLAISTLVYGIGHISGGHINPAVTFSFMWMRTMSLETCLAYMFAQFFGAWFGALLLWGSTASLVYYCDSDAYEYTSDVCSSSILPDGGYGPPFGLGANQLASNVTNGCGFLIEAIGTYLLVFTVLLSTVHTKRTAANAAPIAIGWAVLIAHLVLVPLTGCGINPARSFGPLVVNSMAGMNRWTRGWWVFFIAPFVGSWFATLTYQFIFRLPAEDGDGLKTEDELIEALQSLKMISQRLDPTQLSKMFESDRIEATTTMEPAMENEADKTMESIDENGVDP